MTSPGARARRTEVAAIENVVCAELPDGTLVDLSLAPPESRPVAIDEPAGREVLRHSTAHVMAQAVLNLFPGAKYAIGPPIEDGFYYDFDIGRPFSPEDLEAVEGEMARIIAEDQPFEREEVPSARALKVFDDQPFKVEIITGIEDSADQGAGGETVSLYHNRRRVEGPHFVDLCRGPHVPSTGRIPAFKLMRTSGAYWRGDERRPMLQRIYGTAWESQEALAEHLHRLEEAERRDHRRLGTQLELFSFPTELGGGLSVWHPNGGVMRRVMEEYSRQVHERNGYQFVYSPHVARSNLWETSGHLGFYAENMYPPMELEGARYYVKPMNCPFHLLIYRSRIRSYRELPLRLFELGAVYRYERSGVLHGLMRVRGFTQDDAHIFVTEEQLVPELESLLGFVLQMLREFGFETFEASLSTRNPEKSVGTDEGWALATDALRRALEAKGIPYTVEEGEAAFYGPKIDVQVRDAIGRLWQLSTLQVDFNMSERFGLEYIDSDNQRKRPYMIHRALFGSVERFFGILVEHYAGAFPTWLAPVQALIVPIADRHHAYAAEVAAALEAEGIRVSIDDSTETLGNRIRKAQASKVPHVLVTGDKEVEARTVSARSRSGKERRGLPVDDFVAEVVREVAEHRLPE